MTESKGVHGFANPANYGFRTHTPEELISKAKALNHNTDLKKLNKSLKVALKGEKTREMNLIKAEIAKLEEGIKKINQEINFYEKRSLENTDTAKTIAYDEKIYELEQSIEPLEILLKEQQDELSKLSE